MSNNIFLFFGIDDVDFNGRISKFSQCAVDMICCWCFIFLRFRIVAHYIQTIINLLGLLTVLYMVEFYFLSFLNFKFDL